VLPAEHKSGPITFSTISNKDNATVIYIQSLIIELFNIQPEDEELPETVKETLDFLTSEKTTSFRDLLELLVKVSDTIDSGDDNNLVKHPLYRYFCTILVRRGVIIDLNP